MNEELNINFWKSELKKCIESKEYFFTKYSCIKGKEVKNTNTAIIKFKP